MEQPSDILAPAALRSASASAAAPVDPFQVGPLEKVYVIWLAGATCEGCTVAATGGTHPRLEQLLTGVIPGVPRIELIHALLAIESGAEWVHNLVMAERGELDAPYVVTWEGSVMDESIAGEGHWMGLGQEPGTGRQVTSMEWLDRLAPGAAAVMAIGTCATWGGIPAAKGNPTNAMSVMDHLGPRYRSAAGVPIINVPGCSPVGDNYLETVAATLLFLQGLAPLPEFDELGRPAWLFGETVHRHCPRVDYYEAGVFAEEAGDKECLVELGCWGPVVQCNIVERGIVDGHGGCMQAGGICIGCTMPGFPDDFSPMHEKPPAWAVSGAGARRVPGNFSRRLDAARRRRHTIKGRPVEGSAVNRVRSRAVR